MSDARRQLQEAVARCLGDDEASEIHLHGVGAVRSLEDRLKRHYGMRHAVCVSNATAGLLVTARALDLEEADFVTTPYTYGGSLSGWMALGNRPVFADIDAESLTLDPGSVRQRITARTRAILAVDIYGNPADTIALRKLADEHDLIYVADAAQSLGATRSGRPASVLADALVVSFTCGKSVFAGEGGAVVTNSDVLYEKLLWHGQHPHRQKRELGLQLVNEFGLNARIHPLAAIWADAIFETSLGRLATHRRDCFRVIRALNAIGLTERIGFEEAGIEPAFFRLTAVWKNRPNEAALVEGLSQNGVGVLLSPAPARVAYQQPSFRAQFGDYRGEGCPIAEAQAERRFCIHVCRHQSKTVEEVAS